METNTRFVRLSQNTKRYKGRKEDLDVIFRELQALRLFKQKIIKVIDKNEVLDHTLTIVIEKATNEYEEDLLKEALL